MNAHITIWRTQIKSLYKLVSVTKGNLFDKEEDNKVKEED